MQLQLQPPLVNVDGDTSVALHYGTTGRSRVEGEWPSLIFNFLNDNHIDKCKIYYVKVILFALENHKQIVKQIVIVQTLKKLSIATGGINSPKNMWESIYCFMTDAISKILIGTRCCHCTKNEVFHQGFLQ